MKKRVRIYKPADQWRAQMGGYQATEAAAPQAQLTDEDLINATVKMLAQGSQPQEVLNSLVENGIEQQKATEAVKYSVDYIKNIQDSEYDDVNADTEAQQQAALEEAAAERQAVEAQEAEAKKARMQELYGLTDDNTTQDYSDDEQAMMDMMRYGGLPNKRTFIKNSVNLAKKQMGGQEQQAPQSNRADNTDTGDRQAKLQKFVGSLQNHANEALMKEDAEAAYNQMQMMQPQMPFMPMAQEGGEQAAAELDPRQQRQMARQQRQMGRQMNRMIGNIPVGLYNNRAGGLPTNIGVINMPAIGTAGLQSLMAGAAGLQNYLPSSGSIPGGPKLANIDVRKTGLFGRPKQYSITFAQDVVTNPTTAENAAKQEVKNIEEEAKDATEKIDAAAEDVKKADEATKAAEETVTKSTSGTKTASTTKKATTKKTTTSTASKSKAPVFNDYLEIVTYFNGLSGPKKFEYLNNLKSLPAYKTNPVLQGIWKNLYDISPFEDESKSVTTNSGLTNFTFEPTPKYGQFPFNAYLQSPKNNTTSDTEEEPSKFESAARTAGTFGPAAGIMSLFQEGGFTQEGSGLYKFVYGGNDMYEPPIPGKITDDPYFQYGGLKTYADGDEVKPVSGTGTEADPNVLPEAKVTDNTAATTTAKTPDYSINPMTGKAWTDAEWAMASKLLGNVGTQATTSTNTSSEDAQTANNQTTGYNYGYNTGVGPIYPPLFGGGRGRGLQNLLSLTPFGTNPLATYAGTWTQQKGLPVDPATGQPYTGDFANPQIAKIDVRKTGLFGRPKKYSIDYMVDDVAGTSSFLNPEDYPGGVNPGPGGATPPATTSDGLAIDPETGEPLPIGREIKNLKLKSFMSKIPGVRNMINWGDATEMTPEEEFRFKTKSEMERNMAAEERGDIVAPPIPGDEAAVTSTPDTETTTAPQSTAEKDARTRQTLQMQQNMADEESGDLVAPLPPGERTTRTADERSFDVERRVEPMVEGLPEGTPEDIRNYFAQQRSLSPSSFGDYQAGPMQNIDASVAEQFGVPQSMTDQFAYQAADNTDGSAFDLSTQRGFDKQQYLNESLGREQLDVSQRPTTGSLTPGGIEQINTGYSTPNIIQAPQTQAEYDRVSAELIKQGKPINQQNIMQQVAKEQAGVQVKEWQAAEAEQRRIAAQKAAAKRAAAAAASTSAGASSSGSGTKAAASSATSSEKFMSTSGNNKGFDRSNRWENNYKQSNEDKNANMTLSSFGDDITEYTQRGITESEVRDMMKSALTTIDKKHPTFIDKYYSLRPTDRTQYIDYITNKYGMGSEEMLALKALASGVYTVPKKSQKHGGLHKAYDGVQTPVSGDPRFASSYEEMMRNMADEEAGLLAPPPIPGEQAPGMKQIEFGDVEGVRQNAAYSDKMFGTNYTEDYGLNKPGRKKVRVDYKNKNMWTIDPLVGVEAGLAGAKGLTRFLNTRDERKREKELAQSLTSDSVYGSRSARDQGTYDPNSGLFRPNEMGANVVSKYGGTPFKEGGTTYMSAAQVKKFLEEGGELEFV
jgi:hypothetical protein